MSRDVSGNMFSSLEDGLSTEARHAFGTLTHAFWRTGQGMTCGEIRESIKRLYGADVDRELEQHFHDRREAVLPRV